MLKTIGITACSDPLKPTFAPRMNELKTLLEAMQIATVVSPYMYDRGDGFSGTARERARALLSMYEDPAIDIICDLSGGDMANAILPYLDFACMKEHTKPFFGYSDLTTIINAIYAKTGQCGVLYQLRNLLYADAKQQAEHFRDFSETYTWENLCLGKHTQSLFSFPYTFIQGERMEGVLIGGNIRCFLKLAGTDCMPDFSGKLLLLEAFGGGVSQMITYLSQLKLLGAFEKLHGIVLGTFTKMDEQKLTPDVITLVKEIAGEEIAIVKTEAIGHGSNSQAALIGGKYLFEKK